MAPIDAASIPKDVLHIVQTLKGKGFQAYVVGGSLRDVLLHKTPADWDVTTNATPEEVSKLFTKAIPTGIEFGTVAILLNDVPYEVTTYRAEEKYSDGRHPDSVRFAKTIEEDLSRRDFTINAIAYDPIAQQLIDPFQGQEDLAKRMIRTVGVPLERFQEDGLRPFRACRLAAKLDFAIDHETLAAIPQTLDTAKKIAVERIHDELCKLMEAEKPSIGVEYMRQTGLLQLVLPELIDSYGVSQPKAYHKYDVYWHLLYACDAAPSENRTVRLAALFHDIAKPQCKVDDTFYGHDKKGAEMTTRILSRLRFSNDDIDRVSRLVGEHMFQYLPEWSDSAVRRFMRRVGTEHLDDLFALRKADVAGMEREVTDEDLAPLRSRIQRVLDQAQALHVKQLKVDGHDVMRELNIAPGKVVGQILNELLEKVLEEPHLNDREKLLTLIQDYKQRR